jgi:hypothetical protein
VRAAATALRARFSSARRSCSRSAWTARPSGASIATAAPPGNRGQLAHLVEQRPQRDRLQPQRGPARELQELVDDSLEVPDLAFDARHLVEPLGLPGERIAQQPGIELEPPEGLRTSCAMPASIICMRSSRARSAARVSSRVWASTPISSRVSIGMGASRSPRPRRAAACASRAIGPEIRRDSQTVSSNTASSAPTPVRIIERRRAASAAG